MEGNAMPVARTKQRRTGKNKLRALLPESASTVIWEGRKFVALPDQEVDAWLEDLVDGIESTLAMRDKSRRLTQDEVKKRYGIE